MTPAQTLLGRLDGVQSWATYQKVLLRRVVATTDPGTRKTLMELFRRAGHVAVRLGRPGPRASTP